MSAKLHEARPRERLLKLVAASPGGTRRNRPSYQTSLFSRCWSGREQEGQGNASLPGPAQRAGFAARFHRVGPTARQFARWFSCRLIWKTNGRAAGPTDIRVPGYPARRAGLGKCPRLCPCKRAGLSLLEVMLALAILGGALAAIGELMRIGSRNAEMARDLTTAQLLCESTMAEVQLGFLPMQTVGPVEVNDLQYQQEWLYTITVEPIDQEGLTSVWVRIEQNPEVFSRPVAFQATRWMIDPSVAALTDESLMTTGGAGG